MRKNNPENPNKIEKGAIAMLYNQYEVEVLHLSVDESVATILFQRHARKILTKHLTKIEEWIKT